MVYTYIKSCERAKIVCYALILSSASHLHRLPLSRLLFLPALLLRKHATPHHPLFGLATHCRTSTSSFVFSPSLPCTIPWLLPHPILPLLFTLRQLTRQLSSHALHVFKDVVVSDSRPSIMPVLHHGLRLLSTANPKLDQRCTLLLDSLAEISVARPDHEVFVVGLQLTVRNIRLFIAADGLPASSSTVSGPMLPAVAITRNGTSGMAPSRQSRRLLPKPSRWKGSSCGPSIAARSASG